MRNIWKGAISFGLVHIPVKLYSATERKEVKFNYLHEKCKTPIKYQRVCPACEQEVRMEEIVKGFEYEKGRYVILQDEDLENLPSETAKTVEISNFVDLREIDPIYYDRTYYLAPGNGGQKAYELLKQAMQQSSKVAVAKVAIRSKESLAVIRVYQDVLVMETMFYPDEIRGTQLMPEVHYNVTIHENETKMAAGLVDSLTESFNPEKYHSNYREELHNLIQAKIAGAEIEVPSRIETGKVVDLMEALKASIQLAKEEKAKYKKRKPGRAKKAAQTVP